MRMFYVQRTALALGRNGKNSSYTVERLEVGTILCPAPATSTSRECRAWSHHGLSRDTANQDQKAIIVP